MIIALTGKPNVGKSTFFKASTLAEVEIANYPFTTLKSHEGVAFVKINCVEKEFNVKCNPKFGYCLSSNRFIPIKLIDIPGLIEGSHKGLGRGNEFLDDIREADCLIHIIDISGSTNEKGEVVDTLSYNPVNDVKFLENELDVWFLQILKKGWEKFTRTIKQENLNIKQALAKQLSALKVTEEIVEDVIKKLKLSHNPNQWSNDDLKNLATELRKLTKPLIIAANKIDVEGSKLNLDRLKEEFKDYKIIPCSAESELALREAVKHNLIDYIPGEREFKIKDESKLNEQQKRALSFIKKLLQENSTGIQEVLNEAVFNFLDYIVVYPVANNKLQDKDGRTLPDALLMKNNSTALDLAYKVHTNIGDNFIKGINLKNKQVIGKDYKLKNDDVIEIVTKK